MSRLRITPPDDYRFTRDACSYGYFLLAPNRWDPADHSLTRPLRPGDAAAARRVTVELRQPTPEPGATITVRCDRTLDRAEQRSVRAQITRMLNLDDAGVAQFHRVDRRWKRSGRARLFRSPTLFEDVIKTVTSCNVAWPSTIYMNARLCDVVDPAFPAASQLARRRPASLRARCRVGYRDVRIVELAKRFRRGAIDEDWLTDPATPDADAYAFLLTLPGIGPYAAANIMQLLGRYGWLPIDTETVRHARSVLGYEGDDAAVRRACEQHYARFGAHKFRSYWFELWRDYERKKGPASSWNPRTTGAEFTASKL